MKHAEGAASTSLLRRWREALRTANPPPGPIDAVTRWLVITRAAVFPMTIVSGAVAGLLAVGEPGFRPWLFALTFLGLLLAHAANNVMNDLFDLEAGSDTPGYPRALYAPHPVLSGWVSRHRLWLGAAALNAADLAILVTLLALRGWPVAAFALAGFMVSAAYTAPPLRLKRRGLGELAVLVVWGPLMVGGTYYAAVGRLPGSVVAASLPYALLATSVLMGKHIDKLEWDEQLGIRTLPVLLGERRARLLTQCMMAGFYGLVISLAIIGWLPWPSVLALAAVHRLVPVWKTFARPRPGSPPERFPVWPLWFAAWAFVHARHAGALFVAGLVLGVLVT